MTFRTALEFCGSRFSELNWMTSVVVRTGEARWGEGVRRGEGVRIGEGAERRGEERRGEGEQVGHASS